MHAFDVHPKPDHVRLGCTHIGILPLSLSDTLCVCKCCDVSVYVRVYRVSIFVVFCVSEFESVVSI